MTPIKHSSTTPTSHTSSSSYTAQEVSPTPGTSQAKWQHKRKNSTIGTLVPRIQNVIYHITWKPPTHQARTEFLLMHHNKLSEEQIKNTSLINILSDENLRKSLSYSCNHKYYESRRVIYIYEPKKKTTTQSLQTQWSELFISKFRYLQEPPIPIIQKERNYLSKHRYYRKKIVDQLEAQVPGLFAKLENGTINFKEYFDLRSVALKMKDKECSSTRSIMFPGSRSCNDIGKGSMKKFFHPVFNLAAVTFITITSHSPRRSKILTQEHKNTISKLQEGSLSSLMDLEDKASTISAVMGKYSFKLLIDHATAKMEEIGTLTTTGPINDVIPHHNVQQISNKKSCLTNIDSSHVTFSQTSMHQTSYQQEREPFSNPSIILVASDDEAATCQETNSWTETTPHIITRGITAATTTNIQESENTPTEPESINYIQNSAITTPRQQIGSPHSKITQSSPINMIEPYIQTPTTPNGKQEFMYTIGLMSTNK